MPSPGITGWQALNNTGRCETYYYISSKSDFTLSQHYNIYSLYIEMPSPVSFQNKIDEDTPPSTPRYTQSQSQTGARPGGGPPRVAVVTDFYKDYKKDKIKAHHSDFLPEFLRNVAVLIGQKVVNQG